MILIQQITKDSKKWKIFNFKWRVNIASEIMISAPFWKSVILLYKTWVFKDLKIVRKKIESSLTLWLPMTSYLIMKIWPFYEPGHWGLKIRLFTVNKERAYLLIVTIGSQYNILHFAWNVASIQRMRLSILVRHCDVTSTSRQQVSDGRWECEER